MSVYKDTKTGKWYYEFSYRTMTGETKRRKKRGFDLKKDAQEAEAIEKIKLKEAPPSTLTFGQLYELFVEAKSPEWLPNTKRRIQNAIEHHVLPYFNDAQLDKITTKDIEDWKIKMYGKITDSGEKYKADTLNGFKKTFSAVFNYAVNHQFLTFNPVRAVTSFKDPTSSEAKKEKQVWSPDEFDKFINVVDSEKWHLFFTFLWVTGVRIGEAQGVMFKDINFADNTVSINKSIDTKQKGKKYVINPTKTKKTRIIELPETFVAELKPYYKKMQSQDEWTKDKFLFGFENPLPNSTIDKKRETYIKEAGVKYISSHCFRHSHATYLLSNGIDIKSVSERLGHKDVEETLNTYVHVLPSNKSRILNLLDKSIKNYANFTPQQEKPS